MKDVFIQTMADVFIEIVNSMKEYCNDNDADIESCYVSNIGDSNHYYVCDFKVNYEDDNFILYLSNYLNGIARGIYMFAHKEVTVFDYKEYKDYFTVSIQISCDDMCNVEETLSELNKIVKIDNYNDIKESIE